MSSQSQSQESDFEQDQVSNEDENQISSQEQVDEEYSESPDARRRRKPAKTTKTKMQEPSAKIEEQKDDEKKSDVIVSTFKFPVHFLEKESFKTIEEIFASLHKEEEQLEEKDKDQKNLWLRHVAPNYKNAKHVYLNCKYCKCKIHLEDNGEKFCIKKATVEHVHKTQNPNFKRSLTLKGLEYLDSYFKCNSFKWKDFREEQEMKSTKRGLYPSVIVAVSRTMEAAFEKFGREQTLMFNITYNVMKNKSEEGQQYGLALIMGFDSNLRPVMFGVGTLLGSKSINIYNLLHGFFELVTSKPVTIIINDNADQINAVEKLINDKVFTGNYVFNHYTIVKSFYRRLYFPKARQNEEQAVVNKRFIKKFTEVMNERNQEVGLKKLIKLSKNSINTINEKIVSEFISKASRLCLFRMPNTYVGPCRFSLKHMKEIVKSHFTCLQKTYIINAFEKAEKISQRLTRRSQKGFQLFKEEIIDIFQDKQIELMRLVLERNIYRLFVQNYFIAFKDYTISREQDVFVVVNLQDKTKYTVKDYRCECTYFIKMGIPCEHMCLVGHHNAVDYKKLFHPRWIKVSVNPKLKREERRFVRRGRKPKNLLADQEQEFSQSE